MHKLIQIFLILAVFLSISIYNLPFTNVSFAQSGSAGVTTGPNPESVGIFDLRDIDPLKTKTVGELLDRIIGFFLVLSIPIATLMIIVGAFQILTAAGKIEKVSGGKKTIISAVVGLGVILLARILIAVLKGILGAS